MKLSPHIRAALQANRPMSREEEVEVARRAKDGDRRARDRMVLCNLGSALKIAFKFQTLAVPFDDLVQYALEGLCVAVDKYDPDSGFRFHTYAIWWVRSSLQRNVGMKESTVRKGSQHGRRAFTDLHVASFSIDALDIESPACLASQEPSQAERHEREQERARIGKRLWRLRLTPREMDIVESRWMTDEPESLKVIGDRYGISRERVRQIEHALRARLQHDFADLAA